MTKEQMRGAFFSDDRKYRYALWRCWDLNKKWVMFIGLNPSTANEKKDDPTIRRVVSFARSWGYGGVYMMNLFSIVSSDPSILTNTQDALKGNDHYLRGVNIFCKDVVFAWGSFKVAKERAEEVIAMFPKATCLGINKNGTPKHPLFVAGKTSQINFK